MLLTVSNAVAGDLAEAFEERARRLGRRSAVKWYLRQFLRSLPSAIAMRFGDILHSLETRRKRSESSSMETLLQDLKYGLRSIVKTPGFAVVSIATLALAIGVNTAIFSLVNVIVFADLPMEDPERVAVIRSANPSMSLARGGLSVDDFLDLREESRSFSSLAATRSDRWVLTGAEEPTRLEGRLITPSLFEAWQISTVLGRQFLPEDAQSASPPTAILSHGYWQRSLGGRPDILGSSIRLDGMEYSIVGVMTPGMEFANLSAVDVWVPLVLERGRDQRGEGVLSVSGLLREGVSPAQARAEVEGIGARISEANPETRRGWEIRAEMTRESLIDDDMKIVLVLLGLSENLVCCVV